MFTHEATASTRASKDRHCFRYRGLMCTDLYVQINHQPDIANPTRLKGHKLVSRKSGTVIMMMALAMVGRETVMVVCRKYLITIVHRQDIKNWSSLHAVYLASMIWEAPINTYQLKALQATFTDILLKYLLISLLWGHLTRLMIFPIIKKPASTKATITAPLYKNREVYLERYPSQSCTSLQQFFSCQQLQAFMCTLSRRKVHHRNAWIRTLSLNCW